jgi:hypothetical protein
VIYLPIGDKMSLEEMEELSEEEARARLND